MISCLCVQKRKAEDVAPPPPLPTDEEFEALQAKLFGKRDDASKGELFSGIMED